MQAVRSQIGDDVTLMCAANQRWDLYTANLIMPVLEEARMDWGRSRSIPMTWTTTGASSTQPASTSPLAKACTRPQFASFIAAELLRVVQVDATRVAGVTEWLR